jgi:hypothetical protein
MKIIGISGRKQSGKSTFGNFAISIFLAKLDYAKSIYIDTETGELLVSDLLDDDRFKGIFDTRMYKEVFNDQRINIALEKLNKKVKIYNFADVLKNDICMNMLGLSYGQCYGDDDKKNTLTDIMWKNMPGYEISNLNSLDHDPSGYMTARQVMQFVGTDMFRKMKTDVWVRSTINKILNEQPEVAIITDCRFPNEVESIKNMGGSVIRLTRNPFNSDHTSETILDKDNYDWSNFDHIIENDNINITEYFDQSKAILSQIIETNQ